MADTNEGGVAVKDGEIVVKLSEIRELKARAARVEELEILRGSLTKTQEEKAELEAKHREERIRHRINSLKIPAFRFHLRAIYDMALQMPAVKTYALTDPKQTFSAEEVVNHLIDDMNRQSEVLFSTMSIDEKRPAHFDPDEPEGDPGKLVEYRITRYRREHPQVDYKTAMTHVLNADPDLKEAYRRS